MGQKIPEFGCHKLAGLRTPPASILGLVSHYERVLNSVWVPGYNHQQFFTHFVVCNKITFVYICKCSQPTQQGNR